LGRLVLHIGTHKTATTSIQHYLFENRHELRRRGVLYPDYEIIGHQPHYAHIGIINALSREHDKLTPDDAHRFFTKVRSQARDFDVTIISAEPLYRHVSGHQKAPATRAPITYWAARENYIRMIREVIGDAEIVVVFRRQAEYAQALYQEHVKVTRYNKRFEAFLDEFWFHFTYLQQLEKWQQNFLHIRALTFEQLVAGGEPAEDFGRWLGLPVAGLPPARRINTSWPTDAVILKRLTNRSSTSRRQLQRRIDRMLTRLPPQEFAQFARRSFFADVDAMRAFQAHFDSDNARLKHRFRFPGSPSDLLFPETVPDTLAFGDKLDPDFVALMLKQLT